MIYRELGKTGEMVSVLGFGCMRFPVIDGDHSRIDEEKASEMMIYAMDRGINYIDTAWPYHGTGMENPGSSEPFVGKVLKQGYRKKIKLATKLPSWLVIKEGDAERLLDEQLKRLDTDYIDFYLVHTLNDILWPQIRKAGVPAFLDKAIGDGRIRHAGFSYHEKPGSFAGIVDGYDWSFCQIQYNYMDEEFQAGRAGLEYAASKGLGIVVMEPLRGGKLTNNLPENVQAVFDRAEPKRSPAEWALRWVWNHSGVGVVLSGMSTMEQVIENVALAEGMDLPALDKGQTELFSEVKKLFREKIQVDCTGCGYCMPCPEGVQIPRCFDHYNNHFIYGGDPAYRMLMAHQKASACVECGQCEEHCPQGLPIREDLKKVVQLFEVELGM